MKIIQHTIILLFSAFILTSCGDSHDKLMEDQLSWMEEITEVLNGAAEGDISSAEATARIKKLGKEGKEFTQRKKVLNEGLSETELTEIRKKHGRKFSDTTMKFMHAIQRLQESGRATKELTDAMQNMKN